MMMNVRSVTLVVAACLVGFAATQPSLASVRTTCVVVATGAIVLSIVGRRDAADDRGRRTEEGESEVVGPSLSLHPDASAAIDSIRRLSRPGRRAAVQAVVHATENVLRTYHLALLEDSGTATTTATATAGIDDLRDRTIIALDALQELRMQTGSRGWRSSVAASADGRLRRTFERLRRTLYNKGGAASSSSGPPYPLDPSDDRRFVRV